jgi:hypothetical protein
LKSPPPGKQSPGGTRRSSRNKNKLTTARFISITQSLEDSVKEEPESLDYNGFNHTGRGHMLEVRFQTKKVHSDEVVVIQDCKGEDDEEEDPVSAQVAAESTSSQNNVTDEDDLVDDLMIMDAARINIAQAGQVEANIDLFTFTESDLADFLKL